MANSVIILEDEQDIAHLLSQLLSSYGANPIICETLDSALEAMDKHTVKLALLDIMLPEADGRNVAAAMREKGAEFPIYFMTGVHSQVVTAEHMKHANGLLRKPFSIVNLRKLLDKTLGESKPVNAKMDKRKRMLEVMAAIASEQENMRRQQKWLVETVENEEEYTSQEYEEVKAKLKKLTKVMDETISRFDKQIDELRNLLDKPE